MNRRRKSFYAVIDARGFRAEVEARTPGGAYHKALHDTNRELVTRGLAPLTKAKSDDSGGWVGVSIVSMPRRGPSPLAGALKVWQWFQTVFGKSVFGRAS